MDMLDVEKLSIDMNYYCTKMYSDLDSKRQQGSYQFGLKTNSDSYLDLNTRMYSDLANRRFIW